MTIDKDGVHHSDLLPDFVQLAVHVADNRMDACLSITPVEGAAPGTLTAAHLCIALRETGVVRGIEMSMLKYLADDWTANPRPVPMTPPVARGKEAAPEKAGALRMLVKHLSTPNEINLALNRKHYWELLAICHKFQRVDSGTVIARRAQGAPALLGFDVYGEPIEPADYRPHESPGSAVQIVEKNNVFVAGNIYTAAVTGVAYVDNDDLPAVVPIDFNGAVEVRVASNMMFAELVALPAGERGVMPSEEHIRGVIKSKGIIFGLHEEEFATLMLRFRHGIENSETHVIASGQPPVKGDDGRVELCFNAESSPAPALNPDGSVDYKSISIVTAVEAGEVLARLHPPSKGIPGKDIGGRPLPARDGAPAMFPLGANTIIPKENTSTLVSTVSGIVRYDGTAINVSEGYLVGGDVDYSTGHINYPGSVTVKSDIKSGFNVECGADLQVNGIIEDSNVRVKGNVLCRYGFVGRGKGLIEAEGDVNLGYMKNQTIITRGSVNIAKEVINSNIMARGSINIYGHSLSAAGGTLIACGTIVLKTVGNISHIETTLQIDPDPDLVEEAGKIRENIEHNNINIKKLVGSLEKMTPAQKNDKDMVRKMKNAIITIKQQATALEDRLRLLGIQMNRFDNSFIRIDRCAYPGTIIKIGSRSMTLTDMLAGGKTIRVIDGEIRVM